jgi:calcineurin-like phosphoesterase family protein
MANIFFISDTHFGHANILNFLRPDGSHLRRFSSVAEMDEHIISKWNAVVRPFDKVYHLGDVSMLKAGIATVARCNGQKRLLRGNHDTYRTEEYLKYFEEIYATRVLDEIIFSHIPIHPKSLGRFRANVHGHIHASPAYGAGYFDVSVEAVDYTPLSLEELKRLLPAKVEGGHLDGKN